MPGLWRIFNLSPAETRRTVCPPPPHPTSAQPAHLPLRTPRPGRREGERSWRPRVCLAHLPRIWSLPNPELFHVPVCWSHLYLLLSFSHSLAAMNPPGPRVSGFMEMQAIPQRVQQGPVRGRGVLGWGVGVGGGGRWNIKWKVFPRRWEGGSGWGEWPCPWGTPFDGLISPVCVPGQWNAALKPLSHH